MINHWWCTRPKRSLTSIPEILAVFAGISLKQRWTGSRDLQLLFEEALEEAGLKRKGERRDQRGSGGRTYKAWLESLGLIFIQETTGRLMLTLAGEALIKDCNPVEILKHQVLKYQFPSAFSIGRNINVSQRFRIKPFIFLLRLINDSRINFLSQEEIAKIIICEAETEKDFEKIVARIIAFRNYGDSILPINFNNLYYSGRGNVDNVVNKLNDVANTIVNWLKYTQLVKLNTDSKLVILEEKKQEVTNILSQRIFFIDRPENYEYFQRKYGVDPDHTKDTRDLTQATVVTPQMISEQKIKTAFLFKALKEPITNITDDIINEISEKTGIEIRIVQDILLKFHPKGAISAFLAEYYQMAFKGRSEATKFEEATAEIFKSIFQFGADHTGNTPLSPDVVIFSNIENYSAIIDNKAYSSYSITNDHKNRMVHNYIPSYKNNSRYPELAFFTYIAGGFGRNIDNQIQEINLATSIDGSAISVSNMITMIEKQIKLPYAHTKIREIFSCNRQVLSSDL